MVICCVKYTAKGSLDASQMSHTCKSIAHTVGQNSANIKGNKKSIGAAKDIVQAVRASDR